MKSPVVYPVSADLSALLGAAVDADVGWTEPVITEPLSVPGRVHGAVADLLAGRSLREGIDIDVSPTDPWGF